MPLALDFTFLMDIFLKIASIIGILAWLILLYMARLFSSSRPSKFSPSSISLKIFRMISHSWIKFTLLICGIYSVISLAPAHIIYPTWGFVAAILVGGTFYFIMGGKGFGVPLGHGLKVTIDRAPKLGLSMSKYVMSFHVDRQFIKHRLTITELMIDTMNSVNVAGLEYDFVLKSWLFADRKTCDESLVKKVALCQRTLRSGVLSFIPICIAVLAIWFMAYFGANNEDLINYGMILFIFGISLVIATPIFMWLRIRRLTSAVCLAPAHEGQTEILKILSKKLSNKTPDFTCLFISYRPTPLLHLIAASFRKQPTPPLKRGATTHTPTKKMTSTFIGIEAGFVMTHSKNHTKQPVPLEP